MKREDLISFYKDTNYKSTSLSIRGIPPRPSEWNMPLFIKGIYPKNIELFKNSYDGNIIEIKLDQEDLDYFKALMLHESLFNFYKAFYNYLSSLKMYNGGLEHWIEITAYYSKLYLANSIIALAGKSRYVVNGRNHNFVEDIYRLINPDKYDKNIRKNGMFIREHAKYGIEIDIDPSVDEGKLSIIKDLGGGGSHSYVWKKYAAIQTGEIDITEMTYDYPQHLSDERNLENYSFEGYRQLDFNLDLETFRQYFERDYIKKQSDMIYTTEIAIVLGILGQLFNLYKELKVKDLPIEKEKLKFICDYTLGDNVQTKKLIKLIDDGFPETNIYLDEYYRYESS